MRTIRVEVIHPDQLVACVAQAFRDKSNTVYFPDTECQITSGDYRQEEIELMFASLRARQLQAAIRE